jgi:hypothetical protein
LGIVQNSPTSLTWVIKHIEVLDNKKLPKIDTSTRLGFCANIGGSKHFKQYDLIYCLWLES